MNILIVNTYYFPNIIGGAEISVKKLAEGLVANGHEVHIICTDVKDDNEIINGVNVHRIKLSNIYQPIELRNKNILKKMIGRINDIYNMFNRKKLKEAILEISPDIMHVNNIYGISPAIWNLAKDMEIKLVHTIRDYYLMCPKISMLKENKICNKKNIVCKVFCNINRNISNKVDFVTAPSQYTLDTFINDGFFNLSKKEKVFNAIDFDQKMVREIYFSKNFNISNDKIIKFVFMGSLNKNKGIDLLLKAFSEVRNKEIELIIAGKGPLEQMVNEYCNMDKRIHYKGFLREEKINAILRESHVLVAPSVWNEPFGRVVIDAYKNCMPVIAGNYGGLKEIVKNDFTGKLIEPNNKNEFIKTIEYFTNRSIIKQMLKNCMDELAEYSIQKQVEHFENIYKICLED